MMKKICRLRETRPPIFTHRSRSSVWAIFRSFSARRRRPAAIIVIKLFSHITRNFFLLKMLLSKYLAYLHIIFAVLDHGYLLMLLHFTSLHFTSLHLIQSCIQSYIQSNPIQSNPNSNPFPSNPIHSIPFQFNSRNILLMSEFFYRG
jgi:hypothetical protein